MRKLTLIAGWALVLAAPLAAQDLDSLFEAAGRGDLAPIERAMAETNDPDVAALLRAGLAAARFDPAAPRDPALARLAEAGDAGKRRAALGIMTGAAFASGDYATAARVGEAYARALREAGRDEDAAGAERAWRLAALLAGQPAQRLEGTVVPGATALRRDEAGLPRITIGVNGATQEAVFDTGANLSVLSASAAERLGVAAVEGNLEVGNGVATTVPVRVGIADRVEIAGTVLHNVAFLIIDDAQLTFPGGYSIEAIVGLPVMRPLGRINVEAAGRLTVAPSAGPGGESNLHASVNDLYVDALVDGDPVALHVDTGATQTRLSALFVAAHPERVAGLRRESQRTASAGGRRESQVAAWEQASLTLAGRQVALPVLPVALPGEGPAPKAYGTIGSDVLGRFESYTIDFGAMRLELGEPLGEAGRG